jgi:hypothetical protein
VRKSILFAAILLGGMALAGGAQASGPIYLLRGLAGIFSTGLDALDEKLVQRGYSATVHPYDYYNSLAEEAARLQKAARVQSLLWDILSEQTPPFTWRRR